MFGGEARRARKLRLAGPPELFEREYANPPPPSRDAIVGIPTISDDGKELLNASGFADFCNETEQNVATRVLNDVSMAMALHGSNVDMLIERLQFERDIMDAVGGILLLRQDEKFQSFVENPSHPNNVDYVVAALQNRILYRASREKNAGLYVNYVKLVSNWGKTYENLAKKKLVISLPAFEGREPSTNQGALRRKYRLLLHAISFIDDLSFLVEEVEKNPHRFSEIFLPRIPMNLWKSLKPGKEDVISESRLQEYISEKSGKGLGESVKEKRKSITAGFLEFLPSKIFQKIQLSVTSRVQEK
jgi:hypothetical protein